MKGLEALGDGILLGINPAVEVAPFHRLGAI
jgi:hypothetical protein